MSGAQEDNESSCKVMHGLRLCVEKISCFPDYLRCALLGTGLSVPFMGWALSLSRSGVGFGLSIALLIVCLVSLAGLYQYSCKSKRGYLCSFWFWFAYHVCVLYWLVYPLTIDISTHGILIPFALSAIPAYLSIPLMFPIYLVKKFGNKNELAKVFIFVISNFLIICFFGHYAPGFPWALPGYAFNVSLEMSQGLSIWGIYGQTMFILLIGTLLGCGNKNKFDSYKLCSVVLVLALFLWGLFRVHFYDLEYTDYKVRCVQGSILQKNKMNSALHRDNLGKYLGLSYTSNQLGSPDFIVWPEASVPYLITDRSGSLLRTLSNVVPKDSYLITGVIREDSNNNVYNSIAVIDHQGNNVVNYDKKRLVPFGEYLPFRTFIPKAFAPIANSIGDFTVGSKSNIINLKGLKIAFMICYEAIFPGDFVFGDVDVIVNVTNDAWFGHTSEPMQHLNMVRARAIEEGVPLIRVTNFGVSAIFDACGREVAKLNVDQVGVINQKIPKKRSKTIYRKFFVDNFFVKK